MMQGLLYLVIFFNVCSHVSSWKKNLSISLESETYLCTRTLINHSTQTALSMERQESSILNPQSAECP